ncbi:acyl carrier protein [Streptomyces sp. 6N223]|uniref:acyl carrier protein n=1 Tax=Streptomyces sp. 6N223 TaxID=3457412 RepID=UPI003FD6B6D6
MPSTHEAVVAALADVLGVSEEDITPETPLERLEMDSLAVAEFATVLAQKYGINLAESFVTTQATTVADVVTCVHEQDQPSTAAPAGPTAR